MPLKPDIRGAVETQRKLHQVAGDLRGHEFINTMHQATLLVTRDARILAPVDTGQLRASITPSVEARGGNIVGIVGSNKIHAPFMELGTGVFAGRGRVRMPPPEALDTWARRHGSTGFVIARAIWKRGGLKPRRFLARALERNEARIKELIGNFVSKIVRK